MADRCVLVQVDVGLHFSNISEVQNFQDAGPATWAHVNGYIDACKCTEIFRNNLHSRVSKGWESKWLKLFTKANMK